MRVGDCQSLADLEVPILVACPIVIQLLLGTICTTEAVVGFHTNCKIGEGACGNATRCRSGADLARPCRRSLYQVRTKLAIAVLLIWYKDQTRPLPFCRTFVLRLQHTTVDRQSSSTDCRFHYISLQPICLMAGTNNLLAA